MIKIKSFFKSIKLRLRKACNRLFLGRYKVSPGVYQNFVPCEINKIVVNLNCKDCCKMGDTLFYVAAITELYNRLGKPIVVLSHDGNHSFLEYILPKNIVVKKSDFFEEGFQVAPIGVANDSHKISDLGFLIIDVHKYDYAFSVSDFILKAFLPLIYLYSDNNMCSDHNYILVSVEVGSQKFMASNRGKRYLASLANLYSKRNNCRLIWVSKNYFNDSNDTMVPDGSSFLAFDELIKSENCIAVFSFDSFIMHYSHLNKKLTFVKFRGKISESEYNAHFRLINNAFNNEVIYI